MEATTEQSVGYIEIPMEFEINAPRERCWKAFTEETGQWWHRDFAMLNPKGKVAIEPWAGGRLFEENENGDALLWCHVTFVVNGSSLMCVGSISPPWGGPAESHLSLTFSDLDGGRTKLTIKEYLYGIVSEKMQKEMHAGWQMFYTESFIPYVEGK